MVFTITTHSLLFEANKMKMNELPLLLLKKPVERVCRTQMTTRAKSDLGNIRPAGRIRPARPFYAARWHLQKCDLISRIKPNLFYSFIGYLRKSRLFALHCRSVFKGKGIVPCTSFDSKDPLLTLLFSKKNKIIDAK